MCNLCSARAAGARLLPVIVAAVVIGLFTGSAMAQTGTLSGVVTAADTGAPIEGGIYKCAVKPVDQAVADGTYAPWSPSPTQVAQLKQIFPQGVCDYSRPDQARPASL